LASTTNKIVLVPLHSVEPTVAGDLPIELTHEVFVRNTAGWLDEKHFELWRDYVSIAERRTLAGANVGLVCEFRDDSRGDDAADQAHDLLSKLFILFRIVNPTRSRFSAVYLTRKPSEEIEVFRLSQGSASPINVPPSQTVNSLSSLNLRLGRELVGQFLAIATNGPERLRRAIRYYEEGYADIRDPVLQFVTWTMGISSILGRENQAVHQKEIKGAVSQYVPIDSQIFRESPLNEFVKFPVLTVGDVIEDVWRLRDSFVHGSWIPPDLLHKTTYVAMSNEVVIYPDILRDAASFVLRKILLFFLQNPQTALG
jgi:hypothetical protein